MKEINLQKHKEVGRVFDDSQSAQGALNLSGANTIFDDVLGKVIPIDKVKVGSIYDEGKILVRMKNPVGISKEAGEFTMIITSKTASKELPQQVLHAKHDAPTTFPALLIASPR